MLEGEKRKEGGLMKKVLQILLAVMLVVSLTAIYMQGWETAMVLLVVCGFSARAYRLADTYREDDDKETYDKQMKAVYGFTVACALLSFYWPYDMYYNFVLFLCLVFHCCINRYVRQGTA